MADRARNLALAALPWLGACTVGNLSYQEVLTELDGVMQIDNKVEPPRLSYRDEGPVASWPLRFVPFLPLQPVLRVFVGGATVTKLENPSGHARDLVEALGDKATGSLLESAEAATRLLQIAALDASNLNRIVAIDALERLCGAHGLPLLPDLTVAELYPATDPGLNDAIEALRQLVPSNRTAGSSLDAVARERYTAALATLTKRPLERQRQRLALISDLTTALRSEPEAELAAKTTVALRLALQHGVDWLLLDLLAGRDVELQPIRIRVFDLLHAAGGSDSVPTLLAYVAAPSTAVRDGKERFEDGLMRLRLIHVCGQLDQTRGARSVLLPGREAWESVAPLQFLCEQILPAVAPGSDIDPFGNPMRVPAQEALCWSLDRRIDYDTAWVSAWYEEFRRSR